MKPFRTRDGRTIIDQLCRCGHRFSRHGDRVAQLPGQEVHIPNHGGCLEEDCPCQRFTFADFLFQEPEKEGEREP